jgi:hypothetical protein
MAKQMGQVSLHSPAKQVNAQMKEIDANLRQGSESPSKKVI